ncbi:hypothetical protein A2529_00095 [Candidatus Peribacteria bacterium RIFOXYD2_FULL_58_15]|nr:MAG: hypothetical protein A2529_00095 [Candidatus Peribacteria bacterium RIFOXYD2_FULL_58_15]
MNREFDTCPALVRTVSIVIIHTVARVHARFSVLLEPPAVTVLVVYTTAHPQGDEYLIDPVSIMIFPLWSTISCRNRANSRNLAICPPMACATDTHSPPSQLYGLAYACRAHEEIQYLTEERSKKSTFAPHRLDLRIGGRR